MEQTPIRQDSEGAHEEGIGSLETGCPPEDTFRLCTAAAKKGLPGALYQLGLLYHTGTGVEQSDERAAEVWSHSSSKGDLASTFALASLYECGMGVPTDREKALELFLTAAHGGMVQAKFKAGLMYEEGIGTEISYSDALRWLREAADDGDARSLFEIGWMSCFGLGCPHSEKEAERIIRISIEKGAYDVLERDGKRGNPYSQLRLGWLYDVGWGVEQSIFKAIVWYTGAKIMGLKSADVFIDRISHRLSEKTAEN